MSDRKEYLGDSVYVDVDVDGYSIRLTTENGRGATNVIVLEPDVLKRLIAFGHNHLKGRAAQEIR